MPRSRTDYIVVHTSATRPDTDIGAADIDRWHKDRGWRAIGYHAVIRLDGTVEPGRPLDDVGAHCRGHNRVSVAVCVVGGVDEDGVPACTINDVQQTALRGLLAAWQQRYPSAEVLGHRDLSPDVDGDGEVEQHEWLKACPSFDVRHWLATGDAVFAA